MANTIANRFSNMNAHQAPIVYEWWWRMEGIHNWNSSPSCYLEEIVFRFELNVRSKTSARKMMSILDEELSSFQWIQLKLLSLDKYWPALVDNTSMSAIGLILASVITVIVTWMLTRDNDASRFRPNTAFRRNQSNRNVTYQDDTSTSLESRNPKGILMFK